MRQLWDAYKNSIRYHVLRRHLNLSSRKDHQQNPDYRHCQQHNRGDGLAAPGSHAADCFCALGRSWQLCVKARQHLIVRREDPEKQRACIILLTAAGLI